MKLSIIIPVYNEAAYLEPYLTDLVDKLKTCRLDYQIILAQNGSRDQTLKIARQLAKANPRLQVITTPVANYGLAVKQGFLAASGDYLVLFDLDYYDVNFLKRALPKMTHYAAIVGAKHNDKRSHLRRTVTTVFSLILKIFFGLKISDTHGIKILHRRQFLPIIAKCRFTREIFDTELLIRGEYEGLKVGEIGVVVKEKRRSRTSIIKRSFKTILDLIKLKFVLTQEYGL